MCYDISVQLISQLKYAERYSPELVDEIKEKIIPQLDDNEQIYYRVSGFEHPNVVIFTDENKITPVISKWGLIPSWVKNEAKANEISNKTLNARIETIFEKPSFEASAIDKRCIVLIDGFFEHHDRHGKKIPNYIYKKDEHPFFVAGLYNEWTNPKDSKTQHTFTIVTTQATGFMHELHNAANEPRMPLILDEKAAKNWLKKKEIIKSPDLAEFTHHEVRPIRGKQATGNEPKSQKLFQSDLDLFS